MNKINIINKIYKVIYSKRRRKKNKFYFRKKFKAKKINKIKNNIEFAQQKLNNIKSLNKKLLIIIFIINL